MEIRSLSIMLYKRFRIRFRTKLRRKIVVIPKKEYDYCGDCDNYLTDDKGRISCVLAEIEIHRIDACCEELRRWECKYIKIHITYDPMFRFCTRTAKYIKIYNFTKVCYHPCS